MEGLDEDAIEDMIEIAKSVAHDYEIGFERYSFLRSFKHSRPLSMS